MPAKFWFDKRGLAFDHKGTRKAANGHPVDVYKGLNGSIDGFVCKSLSDMYKEGLKKYEGKKILIPISAGYALYISGTLKDLSEAFRLDIGQGILGFYTTTSQLDVGLAVWHIVLGQPDPGHREIILCIAPCAPEDAKGHHAYWIISAKQRPGDLGSPACYWKEVPRDRKAKKVRLSDLLDKIVPRLDKEAPLRTLPARDWQWHEVDQQLTLLDRNNTNKNKYVGSDLFHSELSVADDTADEFSIVCTEGIKLIRAAIEQVSDYGEGIKIFNKMGIREGALGLQLRQIQTLREEVRRLEAQRFTYSSAYSNLLGLKPQGTIKGNYFTLANDEKFFVVRSNDKDWLTLDQTYWNRTGDKVHISVESQRIKEAWDTILPILLDDRIVKECKVTNVEYVKERLAADPFNATAQCIYVGAQISVYLHAARDDVAAAEARFVGLMTTVSSALRKSGVGTGSQPTSDWIVDPYLSYRHEIDDLVDDTKIKEKKPPAKTNDITEDEYYERVYVDAFDTSERSRKHMTLMQSRSLYQSLLNKINPSSPNVLKPKPK